MVYSKESRDGGFTELSVGGRSVRTGHNVQALTDHKLEERHETLAQFHYYARSFTVAKKMLRSLIVFFIPALVFAAVPTVSDTLGLAASMQQTIRFGSLSLLFLSLVGAAALLSYRAYVSHHVLSAITNEIRRIEREMRRRELNIPSESQRR